MVGSLVTEFADHVLGCDYDRDLLFVTLNLSSSNLNSVQLKLSAFHVDYIDMWNLCKSAVNVIGRDIMFGRDLSMTRKVNH